MAALTSCDHKDPESIIDFNVRSFLVTGTVYDVDGTPIVDATVSLSQYWYYDENRENPSYLAAMHTGSDGKYQFFNRWPMTMQNVFYIIKVTDNSTLRTIHYSPSELEIYQRPNTDAYDPVTYSYESHGNDFYLSLESD